MKNLLRLISCFLCCFTIQAATFPAADASQTAVQNAVNLCADGDTVTVPVGSAVWDTKITIPTAKNLTVLGAGTNQTILTKTNAGAMWAVNNRSRISGFGVNIGPNTSSRFVDLDGQGWRIDHINVASTTLTDWCLITGLTIVNQPNGVIDHSWVTNAAIVVYGDGYLTANNMWHQPLGLGTTNAVYVEDCLFYWTIFGDTIDGNYGGKYVFRHNSLYDSTSEAHSVQGYGGRAIRSWEIYSNTFNQISIAKNWTWFLRGGTGVVYSNIVTGTWTHPGGVLDNVRSEEDRNGPPAGVPGGYAGLADGHSLFDGNVALWTGTNTGGTSATLMTDSSQTWTNGQFTRPANFTNFWIWNLTDGSLGQITTNTATTVTVDHLTNWTGASTANVWHNGDLYKITDGWQARDQIGCGQDITLGTNTISGPVSQWPFQTLDPSYFWENRQSGSVVHVFVGVSGNTPRHILLNRDYYQDVAKPGYTALVYPHPLVSGIPLILPTISAMTNVSIAQDTSIVLPFTIGAGRTNVASYTMSGTSTNTTLLPNANIVFGGSGANRTATLTPVVGQFGQTYVTITVTDEVGSAAASPFLFTVSQNGTQPPTITLIANQTTTVGHSTGPVVFTIGDAVSPPSSLTVTAVSSDQTFIMDNQIVLAGTDAARSVALTPLRDATGVITITVNNPFGGTTNRAFNVSATGNSITLSRNTTTQRYSNR